VGQNPLPNHGGAAVNMIGGNEYIKKSVDEVTTPMIIIFKVLVQAQMIQEKKLETEKGCWYCEKPDHDIQYCTNFHKQLQRMMD